MGKDQGGEIVVSVEQEAPNPHAHETTPSTSNSSSTPLLDKGPFDHPPNKPEQTSQSNNHNYFLTCICCVLCIIPLLLFALLIRLVQLLFGISHQRIKKNEVLKSFVDQIKTKAGVSTEANPATPVRIRLMIWSLLLLLIVRTVPYLKHVTLLALPLWKWVVVLFFICLLSQALSWTTRFIAWIIDLVYDDRPIVLYWAKGLRRNIASIIFFSELLYIWVRYFNSRPDLQDRASRLIVEYGTCTLVSLVIGTVLWLVKSILLLYWEAYTIHNHFKDRIIKVGRQLYFTIRICNLGLDMFSYKGSSDNNEDRRKTKDIKRDEGTQEQTSGRDKEADGQKEIEKTEDNVADREEMKELIKRAKGIVIRTSGDKYEDIEKVIQRTQLYNVKVVTDFFMLLTKTASSENKDLIAKRVDLECQKLVPQNNPNPDCIQLEDLQEKVRTKYTEEDNEIDSEVEDLCKDLKKEGKVEAMAFKKHLKDAYKNSLALGRTLCNAKEVMKTLDTIMRAFLVVVVILFWLLQTGLATTPALVALASTFLAATFIFGDTCKCIFQGIIFSFVTHPFDVGDLCIIDDTQLEVKRIGILKTTFLKIGGKEEVLYPNTVLATKSIANFKGDPDMNDQVELCFDINAANLDLVDFLETKIPECLNQMAKKNTSKVVIKEVSDKIKIAIHFEHCSDHGDVLHAQYIDKKNAQRSELLREIKKKIKEHLGIKYKNESSVSQSTSSP